MMVGLQENHDNATKGNDMKKTLYATAALALIASPIHAASLNILGGVEAADLRYALATPGFELSSNVDTHIGSKGLGSGAGVRTPYEGTPFADFWAYYAIDAGETAYATFDERQSGFRMLLGSGDTYNTLTFFDGDEITAEFTGADVGDTTSIMAKGAHYIEATGFLFDRVRLATDLPALEFASMSGVPAPVPVPAAGVLLLGALGGVAAWKTRKNRKAA